jgi:nucleoside-diphosphate-sugar epimerase
MRTCVTGAAGFIGQALVAQLRQQGTPLRLLSRTTGNQETFIADLTDNNVLLDGLLDDVDVIYHCAGELNNKNVMRALHVDGTVRLLQAVQKKIRTTHQPLHWVQLSSVGAYGPPPDRADQERIVIETTSTAPVGEYEVTKTCADELVMQLAQTEPLFSYTILRPSIVIGKKMPNQSLRALVKIIRKKRFFYIGSTLSIATYVHVDDVVDALILCASDARARGQIFNLSNDCLMSDIVEAVANHAGIAPPTLCLPAQPIKWLAAFLSLFGKTPLTPERIDAMMKRTRYPNQKIQAMLGYTPHRSVPDTIATLCDE